MNFSYNELFLKILEILKYQDRKNFVKNIKESNHWEAIANCVERLPQSARDEIQANPHDQEVLKKYILNNIYTEELNTVSAKTLADYLQHITPVLTDEQKAKIAAVIPN